MAFLCLQLGCSIFFKKRGTVALALVEAYKEGQGFTPADQDTLRRSVLVKIFDWGRRGLKE